MKYKGQEILVEVNRLETWTLDSKGKIHKLAESTNELYIFGYSCIIDDGEYGEPLWSKSLSGIKRLIKEYV